MLYISIAECCPSWSEFSPFSSCSVSCGGGVMTSYRTCRCGEIGDAGCEGNAMMQAPCSTEECPSKLSLIWKKVSIKQINYIEMVLLAP